MVEFRILREVSKTKKQNHNPGLQESRLCLFRILFGRVPWDTALEKRHVYKSWLIFRVLLLQA